LDQSTPSAHDHLRQERRMTFDAMLATINALKVMPLR